LSNNFEMSQEKVSGSTKQCVLLIPPAKSGKLVNLSSSSKIALDLSVK
jgi:hypothetical protein